MQTTIDGMKVVKGCFFAVRPVKLNRTISDGEKLGFFTAVLTVQPDVAEVADVISSFKNDDVAVQAQFVF